MIRGLLATLVLALACVAALPFALYRVGLSDIPDERLRAEFEAAPEPAVALVWQSLGGTGRPRIARHEPLGYALSLWRRTTDPRAPRAAGPDEQVASLAAAAILPAGSIRVPMLRWHLARAAALVWAGRHWSAEEALSAHLGEGYYGHGFFGLEAAARGYFGRPASELDRVQLGHLVVVPKAPARLDPWCWREPNRAAASRLVELPVGRPPGLLPVPPGACPQLARSSARP